MQKCYDSMGQGLLEPRPRQYTVWAHPWLTADGKRGKVEGVGGGRPDAISQMDRISVLDPVSPWPPPHTQGLALRVYNDCVIGRLVPCGSCVQSARHCAGWGWTTTLKIS